LIFLFFRFIYFSFYIYFFFGGEATTRPAHLVRRMIARIRSFASPSHFSQLLSYDQPASSPLSLQHPQAHLPVLTADQLCPLETAQEGQ